MTKGLLKVRKLWDLFIHPLAKAYTKFHFIADISLATRVAEGTIKNSYKDLYPHLPRLIPNWFAKEEDVKNLCI